MRDMRTNELIHCLKGTCLSFASCIVLFAAHDRTNLKGMFRMRGGSYSNIESVLKCIGNEARGLKIYSTSPFGGNIFSTEFSFRPDIYRSFIK